jgi:arginyl-tRNA synthetase
MILPVHEALRARLATVLQNQYGLAPEAQPPIVIDYPPNRTLGDLAVPIAFELARRLRKAPRAIAQDLAAALMPVPGVARVEALGSGYLNAFLDRRTFLADRLDPALTSNSPAGQAGKAIVEHTAINPNKAAHIGHLRNAALGDTLVRVLRFRGVPVEVQNYIDDTGVQVADVVVGFTEIEQKSLADIRQIAARPGFDYYCWDLYARVTEWYGADAARLALRAATLHDIERGGTERSAIGAFVADAIVRCHLRTMARMNIGYDLLTWEGDILRLQFWARAFEILQTQGTVYLQTQGRLAGCWVMAIDDSADATVSSEEAAPAAPAAAPPEAMAEAAPDEASEVEDSREKVIVRSNGTVTYVGKDIAYQFWKFGLLGLDFSYRPFTTRHDGSTLWATTSDAAKAAAHGDVPAFGRAATTYNVIDVRQSYLQKLLKQALATMGHTAQAERSIHFSYEMVALSHATARELGYELSPADQKKPFVEVSGRKGLGVKADDLLDLLEKKATEEVQRRNPERTGADVARIGREIGLAAVRYFMIKYSRGKVIAFDIDEALSFEGESGPYLQYSVVRANNIFAKLQEREATSTADVIASLAGLDPAGLEGVDGDHELWALVLEASRLDEIVEQVVRSLEFSVLAKWAFGLAQQFNAFYHRAPILNEERIDLRLWRAAGVAYYRAQLTRALDMMGIPVPARM